MPSAQWSKLAQNVAAGEASDEQVRSFSLHERVLKKLPSDFDAGNWVTAEKKYRSLNDRSKAATREQYTTDYIAQKRKVLLALAGTLTKLSAVSGELQQADSDLRTQRKPTRTMASLCATPRTFFFARLTRSGRHSKSSS